MRITVTGMPCSARISQNGRPARNERTRARPIAAAPTARFPTGALAPGSAAMDEIGCKRGGIAVHEIEDAVPGGIQARDERGPGHRALRRRGGGQASEAARSRSRARLGNALQCSSTKSGSMPSTPSTITRFPCAAKWPQEASASRASSAIAKSLIDRGHAGCGSWLLKHRFSIHPRGRAPRRTDPEAVGAMSSMPGSSLSMARFKTARREPARVHAMVAAPGFWIVFDHARGHLAHGRLPGSPVALVVADDQVGRGVEIRAAVELAGWRRLVGSRFRRAPRRAGPGVWRSVRASAPRLPRRRATMPSASRPRMLM